MYLVATMLFTQQDFHLQCLYFLLTPFNTKNCCSLNQISAWCCLLKCFLQKKMYCCFVVNETWETFPHEFIFVFILHFIGNIMTECSSSSIYSGDKADFRVPGRERLQPSLTMCISMVTFSFPDTYEHLKNQLNSFIHSWDTADHRIPMTLKATPIFEHIHQ